MDTDTKLVIVFSGVMLFLFVAWERYRTKQQKKRQQEFQPKYNEFVLKHGVLYEESTIPMTNADRRTIAMTFNILLGFLFLLVGLAVFLLFLSPPQTPYDFMIAVGLPGLLILFIYLTLRGRKKALKANEKEIIKGVITNKTKDGSGRRSDHYIEISGKGKKILVGRAEYKKCSFGDIVKIEILGNPDGFLFKRTITVIGKI